MGSMNPHPSTRLGAAMARDAGGCVCFHPITRRHVDLGRVASAVCQPFER